MSILTHHITRREVPAVRAALACAGYTVSAGDCYRYVSGLCDYLEPMSRGAADRVRRFIAAALEGPGYVALLLDEEAATFTTAAN